MSRGPQRVLAIFILVSAVFAHERSHDRKVDRGVEKVLWEKVLWVEPNDPSSFDFQYGVTGIERQPQPPFRFLNEDLSRTAAKINVKDRRDVAWNIKWGSEARASAFCTRLLRACGYFAQPEYFVASGQIEGARHLSRAKKHVSDDGSFLNARFQLRTDSPKYLHDEHWTLDNNPFVGTPEIQGLKILLILVSNWDTRKSNFGIFEDIGDGRQRRLYVGTDWGASLGRWGNALTRSKWNCKDFADQTPNFVKGVDKGTLRWGVSDWSGIRVSDVQWLLQYLGKVTDAQLRLGLSSSGATPEDTECYTQALRQRIEQLQRAATGVLSTTPTQ
jgi:hypothetical protein